MRIPFLTTMIWFLYSAQLFSQENNLVIKGLVTESESGTPISGAYVVEVGSNPVNGTVTDASGKFILASAIGRKTLKFSFLGYEEQVIRDILVGTGKEVFLNVPLQEKVIQTSDVVVSSGRTGRAGINQMATISTSTIRTDDALRFAGGFYDPSRIVNSFAGIITSNNDYSNDIVIRGNSSRGLLWRLEGIEIPNPNHFSDGQGGSGGAFSAITSNVIANFDFFTGAFPAEFGNAVSGVMDLNLRKGNPDKREYAFQTGMIGAEISAEGPFSGKSQASYLLNARYTNFRILSELELIDLGESNYAPRTKDVAVNINLPLQRGSVNLFTIAGSSQIGKKAIHDISQWETMSDRWEEMESQSSFVAGIKLLRTLQNQRTFIRTVGAYTRFYNSFREGYIDSSYITNNSYLYEYDFPSARFSTMVNHKINAANTIRAGLIYNYLSGKMYNYRQLKTTGYDTLISPDATAGMYQGYLQWKHRSGSNLEINTGLHVLGFSLNSQLVVEPRIGLRWTITPGNAIIAGVGLHSRTESLAVYNSLVKNPDGTRSLLNRQTGLSRSFHSVAGLDLSPGVNTRLHIEGYIQYLFDIPIVNKMNSQYSTINSAERLPDAALENEGTGLNNGIEVTLEKSYTKNSYFLLTFSLFNSWYKAGDQYRYNTYYNTRYVSNFLIGKDFYVGKNKRNSIGINFKNSLRGGYRYTPVDVARSYKSKRIIYQPWSTYKSQLPAFLRIDGGINFRRNHPGYSWIAMFDIQNVTDRKNVFRRRFSFENGQIVTRDILSLGIVPVFNFRVEF